MIKLDKPAIFKDSKEQKQFEKDGFVIKPLLDATQVNALRIIAEQYSSNNITEFYSSSFENDLVLKEELNSKVLQLVKPIINNHFKDFDVLGAAFLHKPIGERGVLPPHQDWTVVDETKSFSMTVWIALDDLTTENGALKVLQGSHQVFPELRSPSLPTTYANHHDVLDREMDTLYLKKGTSFIFNHALIHSSEPNQTNKNRLAVAIGLVPTRPELFMYYQKDDMVQEIVMPKNLFIRYPEVAIEPKIGKFVQEFNYSIDPLSEAELKERIDSIKIGKSNIMEPLFKDLQLQNQFETEGYTKLEILNQEQVHELRAYYNSLNLKDEMGFGFHVGMDQQDKVKVTEMAAKIEQLAFPQVQKQLCDAQLFTASFVIKEPNPKGVVPPHQDWTFVEDEQKHCSVTCWIPLEDVNVENGCIGLLKGSHKYFDHVRPSPSPQAPSPLYEHMVTIFPYLKLVDIKAGEALFFNNKTIHASPPNTTNKARVGIGLGITQKAAEIRHYYLKPGTKDKLLKYKTDTGFYTKYDNPGLAKMYEAGRLIEGYEMVSEVPYKMMSFSKEEWIAKMESTGNVYNQPLVDRMAPLFGSYNTESSEIKVNEPTKHEQFQPYRKEGILDRIANAMFG